ncbi:MAG: NAD-binding protein, partial [Clostridia bacterium]
MKNQCIVIGLGIYGMNVAKKLSEAGMEVLAVDKDMKLVERASKFVTKAVCMDIT